MSRPSLRFLTLSLTLWVASAASAGGAGAPVGSPLRAVPCPADVKATTCGYVKVPLNHAQPSGTQIELFVAVQRATAPQTARQPDPLFYLEGGPGGPSSASVGLLGQVFSTRDVVGIDQRGVGRSTPSLKCPGVNALMARQDIQMAELGTLFSQALMNCGTDLRAAGVALEFFNTTQAALDVDAVRQALGYRQINLYGGSYGTRLAQEVMRRAPAGLRAVVLDSVIPTSVDRVARTAGSVQAALQRVFAACQADQACNATYPDLKGTYQAVLKQLDARPLKVTVAGSGSELNGAGLQALLLGSMYFMPGIQEIPSLIHAARDSHTGAIAQSFGAKFGQAVGDLITWGAFFTNECAGEVAYTTPERLQAGLNAAPEFAGALALAPGISSAGIFKVCQAMQLTTPAPLENAPVGSDVPTLLLAGEFDPVTPAAWLPEAAAQLTRAQSLVVKGASHGAGLQNLCGFSAITQFLAAPTQAIQPNCPEAKVDFK